MRLAAAVVVVAALALLGSIFLSANANGIAVLMVFGAGLLGGLLGSVGDALNSHTLQTIANTSSWLLPFEALYRDALRVLVVRGARASPARSCSSARSAARTTPARCSCRTRSSTSPASGRWPRAAFAPQRPLTRCQGVVSAGCISGVPPARRG